MPRRQPEERRSAHAPAAPAPFRIVVCRDCCWGSTKVPEADHDWQIACLANAPVRVSDCLDVCE